jgi:DNA-directed RNA polymerase specialized sigma24 family protein
MWNARSLGDVVTARSSAVRQAAQSAEHELLATISAGNRTAMAELYFLYVARLANFFMHMTGSTVLVQELISDTMFDVWQKRAPIGSDASVAAWIMGLAYSHVQMRLARESARPRVLPSARDTEHDNAVTTTSQGSPQDLFLKLPFEERAVLHLVYSGYHSRQSIANIMNTSCERVQVLLAQARRLYLHKVMDDGRFPLIG